MSKRFRIITVMLTVAVMTAVLAAPLVPTTVIAPHPLNVSALAGLTGGFGSVGCSFWSGVGIGLGIAGLGGCVPCGFGSVGIAIVVAIKC
jgi:hypothetical protein